MLLGSLSFTAVGSIRESLASNLNSNNLKKLLLLVSPLKSRIWKLAYRKLLYFTNINQFLKNRTHEQSEHCYHILVVHYHQCFVPLLFSDKDFSRGQPLFSPWQIFQCLLYFAFWSWSTKIKLLRHKYLLKLQVHPQNIMIVLHFYIKLL